MNTAAVMLSAVGLLGAAFCAGCSSNTTITSTPAVVSIPLAVHICYVGQDPPDSDLNVGCRLTVQQIADYVSKLESNESTFGKHADIYRDTQADASYNLAPSFIASGYTRTIDVADFQQWVNNNWVSGHINIYFVGNVQDTTSTTGVLLAAVTFEPNTSSNKPFILINDAGLEWSEGFDPGKEPQPMIDSNMLEHEMAHYLARFKSKIFGTRFYDSKEHCGSTDNSILRGTDPPAVFPLVLPGKDDDTMTELGLISQRIKNQNWNNP